MKSWIIYVLALFNGGTVASAWWGAACYGDVNTFWAIPILATIFTIIGLGIAAQAVLDT
jgi:hypothetical protein